ARQRRRAHAQGAPQVDRQERQERQERQGKARAPALARRLLQGPAWNNPSSTKAPNAARRPAPSTKARSAAATASIGPSSRSPTSSARREFLTSRRRGGRM